MPTLSTTEAAAKLAREVEKARAIDLPEIYSELYPEKPVPPSLVAADLARHIRTGLAAEEIVDLWNVMFPEDRNVWYEDETQAIHFNEEVAGYVD